MAALWQNDETFADRVAELCYEHYKKLGKKGKPQSGREWALVAAVVCVDDEAGTLFIVSMGTGSKCLGQSKMSPQGDVLNDSHAEVIARRGFLRYLYNQLHYVYTGKPSYFVYKEEDNVCHLKEGVSFHLFSSHTPCGDASIFPKGDDDDTVAIETPSDTRHHICSDAKESSNKLNMEDSQTLNDEPPVKKLCLMKESDQKNKLAEQVVKKCENSCELVEEITNSQGSEELPVLLNHQDSKIDSACIKQLPTCSDYSCKSNCLTRSVQAQADKRDDMESTKDIYRTGAKCVPGGEQDLRQSGTSYHAVGVLRTKPGRGDPTLSMSCSDKLLKWNVLGCQGALLSYFLAAPIHLSSVIIGKCPFDLVAAERAIYQRAEHVAGFTVHKPRIFTSQKEFEFSKAKLQSEVVTCEGRGKISPSSEAIIWIKDPLLHEVSVNGIRQGVTKANLTTPKARLCICKSSLFDTFKNLVTSISNEKLPLPLRHREMITYGEYKREAAKYSRARQQFLDSFPTWMLQPSWLMNFT